jgi:di/tricarboxylate transporter
VDLAGISLAALVLTILVSCTTRVNPGLLALVFAWLIGVYLAPLWGQSIGMKGVAAGFPTELFLTLTAVTLLFTQAQVNGTLGQVARAVVHGCRGNAGLLPVMFFLLALALSSVGAGGIAAAALVAPLAMAVADRTGVPAFLMAIMVAHGAVAGGLSPFAPTGIIANGLMNQQGLTGLEGQTYANNLLANTVVAWVGYLLFGGWRLFRRDTARNESPAPSATDATEPFRLRHAVTLAVTAALIVGAVFFRVDIGMGALAGAVVLTLLRMADEATTIRAMPWGVILMVCGVTVLTSLLEQTGGTDRFTALVGRVATPRTIPGVIAFLTGLISVYSSTSGVVLPAFLPLVPKLVHELGGGDPAAIASSVVIGGNLVDVAPLSTIGAVCVAGAAPGTDRRALFYKLLAWGLSMAAVGAAVCQVAFGLR